MNERQGVLKSLRQLGADLKTLGSPTLTAPDLQPRVDINTNERMDFPAGDLYLAADDLVDSAYEVPETDADFEESARFMDLLVAENPQTPQELAAVINQFVDSLPTVNN